MKVIFYLLIILVNINFVAAQRLQETSADASRSSEKVFYFVGEVNSSSKISLQQANTLLKAIELAGGTVLATKNRVAVITRGSSQDCKAKPTIITVKLKDILSNKIDDFTLQENDVVSIEERKKLNKSVIIDRHYVITDCSPKKRIFYKFPI